MFLDDELLEMCKKCDADTSEKIQQLNIDVCLKCENYFKSKLTETSTDKELKAVLDRTFNLFDSFVKMAKKSGDFKLMELGDMFERFSFKKQLLKIEKVRVVYESL